MSNLDPAPKIDETFHEKPDNQWLEMWRSLVANRAALVSLVFIGLLAFIAVFGPYLVPYDPIETDMPNALESPSAEHWFGTDQLGMDIFSRVIVGARVSLTVGLLAVSIAMTVGVVLGSIAGYLGGRVDTVIMRVMDMMLAIPSILLAITLMAALGKGIDKAVIAIGLVSIPEYARIVRSNTLSIKENDYVAAARIVGNSDLRIISRHVLPNALSVIIVRTTLGMSSGHSRPGRPWVPGHGRATAAGRMGGHARARARLHLPGSVHALLPGHGDHLDGAGLQPVGGRPA